MCRASCLVLGIVFSLTFTPAQAQQLEGFADMHTHPMSHLAFGGMIVYGAPDEGALMLAGQKYRGWHGTERNCWLVNEPAGSVEWALGFDNAVHGAPGGWPPAGCAISCRSTSPIRCSV